MALWTFFGLARGEATTDWPKPHTGSAEQDAVIGLPRISSKDCAPDCAACIAACPTEALRRSDPEAGQGEGGNARIALDYGRCIGCQRCVDVCPAGILSASHEWALGTRRREDLLFDPHARHAAERLQQAMARVFKHSLHIRHVDAGSCNGCESELQALLNPFYNLHRLGIFFTASPRAADLLLVTGTVTAPMQDALLAAWEAMPEPKWVMAMGACAISGAMAREGYASGAGAHGVVPVDVYLPGCPPTPAAIMQALLLLLERAPQRLHGGRIHE